MQSLIEHLTLAFYIAAWLGFSVFVILASVGGWLAVKIITVSWRVTYARWRWKKYQREIDENKNYLFAHKLANEFIREANKTAATEPPPPPNPFAPQPTQPTNENQEVGSKARGGRRKE